MLWMSDFARQARAGETSSVDILKVAQAFRNETNYTVWSDLSSNLATIAILTQNTDFHDSFKAFVRKLYAGISEKLGWEPKKGESKFSI